MNCDQRQAYHTCAIAAVAAAVVLRLVILACNSVPFDSDEAVVGLMARHMLQGEWPAFFYGQSYMGSLDASLIAVAFAILGESVLAIRVVQSILFLGIVISTYLLGIRLLANLWKAFAAALLVAVPTVLLTTYTTASLGGYGEVLLLGNAALLLGHAVLTDRSADWRAWAGLGVAAGLGFWTSALICVYLIPVGALIFARATIRWSPAAVRDSPRPGMWRGVLVAAACFVAASGPWWWHNVTHGWSALGFLLTAADAGGIGTGSAPLGLRLSGLLALGVPALLGIRFPWSSRFVLLPAAAPVIALAMASLGYAVSQLRRRLDVGRALLAGVTITFALLFLLTPFGTDATGRYFVPLTTPIALWSADFLGHIRHIRRWAASVALLYLLGFNLTGHVLAISQTPPGLTAQLDDRVRFDNRHDQQLISFLHEIGSTRGYSNYWVAFRIAFVSGESVILSAQLPYKPDLSYNPADDRYLPYTQEVARADHLVYVTSVQPALDAHVWQALTAAEVTFSERQIGPYHVFYGLSRHVSPQELGFGRP